MGENHDEVENEVENEDARGGVRERMWTRMGVGMMTMQSILLLVLVTDHDHGEVGASIWL